MRQRLNTKFGIWGLVKDQKVSNHDENNRNSKSDIDELDIDKLKPVADDLYKLSHVVEKEVFK